MIRTTLAAALAAALVTAPAMAVVEPNPSTTVFTFSEVKTNISIGELLFSFTVDYQSANAQISLFNSGSNQGGLISDFYAELHTHEGNAYILERNIWNLTGRTVKEASFLGQLSQGKYEIWWWGDPAPGAGIAGIANITAVSAVPETKTWALLAAGILCLVTLRGRKLPLV